MQYTKIAIFSTIEENIFFGPSSEIGHMRALCGPNEKKTLLMCAKHDLLERSAATPRGVCKNLLVSTFIAYIV